MSIWDCIDAAMNDPEINADREMGERAQKMWKEMSDRYEGHGHPRHVAEVYAAEDLKAIFAKEAGDTRHVFQARMNASRAAMANVAANDAPNLTAKGEWVEYQHRAMIRRMNGRIQEFLQTHHRDLLGRVKEPVQLMEVVRSLHGEAVTNPLAKAMADAISAAFEDLRIMYNEAGGLAGKLENWGLPHSHNRQAVTRAGFDAWMKEVEPRLDWTKIEDPLTGRPMQAADGPVPDMAARRSFLEEVYRNIAFGKETRQPVYGRPQGTATYRKHAERRVLHFRNADDWMAYNRLFGSGDPFASIMGHIHRMSRDVVLMRNYGPNPGLGLDFEAQLWAQKASEAGDTALRDAVTKDAATATRILRVLSGGAQPETATQAWWSTFFSSARHVMTAAMLARASLASVSDVNSLRMAAKSVGMNPNNVLSRHVKLMFSQMDRADAARAGWVADTLADAGTVMARFQQEVAPAEWAERLASASMKIQGLTRWTDSARTAFQMEFAGYMAANADRPLAEVDEPLRKILIQRGITAEEWAELTRPETMFTAGNGATFVSPMWWREATDLPREKADALFFKVQGIVEEQMEYAVPTQSILARAFTDPAAYGLNPGSLAYELMKSGTMFKSFAMTFSINQYRRIMSIPTAGGRIAYATELAAGMTFLGGIAIQLKELASGRDPQDMTDPNFWARAALQGGGFGIIGDIVTTGEARWGGGFPNYVAGPLLGAIQDGWTLTAGNMIEAGKQILAGEEIDTNFAQELSRMGKRYLPLGHTPIVGPAIDRLFWDQLQMILDPESADALVRASKRRENLYGNAEWWPQGAATPARGPDLGAAFGGQ